MCRECGYAVCRFTREYNQSEGTMNKREEFLLWFVLFVMSCVVFWQGWQIDQLYTASEASSFLP